MKHLFLYIILSISFFNCSNLKKETSKNLNFKNQIQNKDISDILKKTESNVTSLIHRARNEFKKTYNNYHEKFK